jgi:toxin HigB-1
MIIRNIIHKGLRRFVEHDDASGLQAATIGKLSRIIAFLQDMTDENELNTVPTWKAHKLSGDRTGTWSLFVTKNRRLEQLPPEVNHSEIVKDCSINKLTRNFDPRRSKRARIFHIDKDEIEIIDLNYEDYHAKGLAYDCDNWLSTKSAAPYWRFCKA